MTKQLKVMMVGDVMGRPGRRAIVSLLKNIRKEHSLDYIIVNGENTAGGFGITQKLTSDFYNAGVDVITMGNHVWANKDIYNFINHADRLIRPNNFPEGTPGHGYCLYQADDKPLIGVINIMGRINMSVLPCPFRSAAAAIEIIKKTTPLIFIDFHSETTSEKIAMGWYLDGSATALAGTHTHVQTADERILPNGTAYITDLGMTGPFDSVIGMHKKNVLKHFLSNMPFPFSVAREDVKLHGIIITADIESGKALQVERISVSLPDDEHV